LRNKLGRCTFTVADLGADVPGRLKSRKSKRMQPLLSWSLLDESPNEKEAPEFKPVRGGGISQADKFDVVSIQFAIHYMLSSKKRARRFFRTVSDLLDVGGNLIATTIDARIVLEKLMNLGIDLHFDSDADSGNHEEKEIIVTAGGGACRIRFQPCIVKRIFKSMETNIDTLDDDVFGLEYMFTLREGSDHASGVGQAVDLPEWLTPIPVLKMLAAEVGLELEYGMNFHEFFDARKDAQEYHAAHLALYNMKVLNKEGSISCDEWDISRMYCAVKFRKVREAHSMLEDDDSDNDLDNDDVDDQGHDKAAEEEEKQGGDEALEKASKNLYFEALMKAKMVAGKVQWNGLSGDEKKRLTEIELKKLPLL
jgi:mRNA (guanine-N7-)-methyltransferase